MLPTNLMVPMGFSIDNCDKGRLVDNEDKDNYNAAMNVEIPTRAWHR